MTSPVTSNRRLRPAKQYLSEKVHREPKLNTFCSARVIMYSILIVLPITFTLIAKYVSLPKFRSSRFKSTKFFRPQSAICSLSAADVNLPSNVQESLFVKLSLKISILQICHFQIQFTLTTREKNCYKTSDGSVPKTCLQ